MYILRYETNARGRGAGGEASRRRGGTTKVKYKVEETGEGGGLEENAIIKQKE